MTNSFEGVECHIPNKTLIVFFSKMLPKIDFLIHCSDDRPGAVVAQISSRCIFIFYFFITHTHDLRYGQVQNELSNLGLWILNNLDFQLPIPSLFFYSFSSLRQQQREQQPLPSPTFPITWSTAAATISSIVRCYRHPSRSRSSSNQEWRELSSFFPR